MLVKRSAWRREAGSRGLSTPEILSGITLTLLALAALYSLQLAQTRAFATQSVYVRVTSWLSFSCSRCSRSRPSRYDGAAQVHLEAAASATDPANAGWLVATALGPEGVRNVTGVGFSPGPPVVPSVRTSPAAPSAIRLNQLIDDLLARGPADYPNENYAGPTAGRRRAPRGLA